MFRCAAGGAAGASVSVCEGATCGGIVWTGVLMNCDHPFGAQGKRAGDLQSRRVANHDDISIVGERRVLAQRGVRRHFVYANCPEGQVCLRAVRLLSNGPVTIYRPWFKTRAISPSAGLSSAWRKLRSAMIQSAPR